jgi:hypothetical protein
MKRILAVFVLACFARAAFAQSTLTPNLSLQIPAYQSTNWQVPLNFNWNLLDTILGGTQTLPTGATPMVGNSPNFLTANTSSTSITNFLGGFPGQTIRIICGTGDTFTAISNSATIKLAATWSCASNSALTLTYANGVWTETARSGGAAQSLYYQTLENASGSAMTQRPIVEFTGTAVASVTDDSTNGRTIVTLTASAGSGVTLQTNGTNNSSQSALNFQNSAATNGLTLTFSNPSGGNVQLGLSGTLNDAGLTSAYSGVGNCTAHEWVNSESRNASPGCAQPAFSDLSGSATASQIPAGNTCGANSFATSLGASLTLGCNQPSFSNLSGTATTNQIGTGTPAAGKYVDGGTGAWTALPTAGVAAQTSAATNFGTALGTQTIVSSFPATGDVLVEIVLVQTRAGVGCSTSSNTAQPVLQINSTTVNGQTYTISGNGFFDDGAGGLVGSGFPSESVFAMVVITGGTSIAYTTTSTLGSTGCSIVPQYTVYAKAIY